MNDATARFRRASAAVVIAFGVLLLHSLPMTHPPGGHSSGQQLHAPAPAGEQPGAAPATVTHQAGTAHTLTAAMSSGVESTTHVPMAMCMAMVTAVAALLVIWHLSPDSDQNAAARSRSTGVGRHLSRAPPWAGPTLEKLSILRI